MGDDVVDLPVLTACGFSASVPNGHVLKCVSASITWPAGEAGRGAVREVCELIIRAQGKWDAAMAEYLA
jgi:3-deoxy-D-manno-octulosonate 8-phosphate phosphatase (KDO 8-P phosphatase)